MSALRQKIEQEMRDCGPIPFSRYMELCLYDPEFGYYSRNAAQFGKAGDFYTSSDVHAVFGRLLARQFEEMWRVAGAPEKIALVELGPGRGLFAQDVLDWSEKKFPDFFCSLHYILVERSPALRQRIESTLFRHFASGKAEFGSPAMFGSPAAKRRKSIADGLSRGSDVCGEPAPEGRKNAPRLEMQTPEAPTILFANEFFDALPVEILSPRGSLRIDTESGRFVESWAPLSPQELEFLDRYSVHPEEEERLEAGLAARQIAGQYFERLSRGFFIAIDYGYTREEQLAGRHLGTLKTIRQHSVSGNAYEAPGEQDITADVNFTALTAVAGLHSMQVQKLITQSQFLLGIGEDNEFADAFEDCRVPQERAKVALQLKHLITPAGMGESFHVLVASKGIEKEKVTRLAGLSFGNCERSRD